MELSFRAFVDFYKENSKIFTVGWKKLLMNSVWKKEVSYDDVDQFLCFQEKVTLGYDCEKKKKRLTFTFL